MKSMFVLFAFALLGLTYSQDCSKSRNCLECISIGCVACPAVNNSLPTCQQKGTSCERQITDAINCPGQFCGTTQCGSDQFCDLSANIPRCRCKDCKKFDESKGQCLSESLCSVDPNALCRDNKCVCPSGYKFVPTSDGKSFSCVSLNCGTFPLGCGPNSLCQDQKCVCKEGYAPVDLDPNRPDTHLGCFLKPLTCNETCVGDNKKCVGTDPLKLACVCDNGYFLNTAGLCETIPQTNVTVDCSAITSCGVCASQTSCNWCQGENSGKCFSVASGSQEVCTEKVASTLGQCECAIKGCLEDQVCGPRGCVCKEGTVLFGEKCIDMSNPCAGFTCKQNEECKNQEISTGVYRPTCPCVEGYIRDSTGNCVEKPTCGTNVTNSGCVCVVVSNATFCCAFPTRLDSSQLRCRYFCQTTNTFADKEEECQCPTGTIRDTKLGICVKTCPDGKPPVDGRCGIICETGQSPNPDQSPGQPACGYTCPDGSFYLSIEGCKLACTTRTPPPSYCPCPNPGEVRLSDGKCTPRCPDGTFPIFGECLTSNPCTQGFPIVLPDGTRSCGRKCENGELLPFTVPCPLPECPDGQLFDIIFKTCANPCADGSAPRSGICQNDCTSSGSCCKPSVDGTNICGPAPCAEGQKRDFATGACVTPCPNGLLPPPGGSCPSEDDCPNQPGFVKVDGVCGVYCNSTTFVRDPKLCCPEGQRYSASNNLCLCPDGSKPVNQRCTTEQKCDVLNDPKCPCPFPLVRSPTSGKCACRDEVNYPNPFDGRRCGLSPCAPGLILSEGGVCVCPLTARLPETVVLDNKEISVCKCDPTFTAGCPITPLNCEGSTFDGCVCLRNSSACGGETAPEDKCKLDRSLKECFCRANPKAPECVLPPLCQIHPNSPECVGTQNCTFELFSIGRCTVDQFCERNPDAKACSCIKLGRCSREGIKISDNKTISDFVLNFCSDLDLKDPRKPECYCRIAHDPIICRCVITPSLEVCRNLTGNLSPPAPNFNADEKCKLAKDPQNCVTFITKTESETDVRIKLSESSEKVDDLVNVVLDKKDRAGLVFVERDAKVGGKAPEGTTVDSSAVRARVGFVVARCFEFFDANDNSMFEDGDKLIKIINFFDLKWTVNTIQNEEQGITTITFTSLNGTVVVTYVIVSKEITIDGVVTSSRTTKLTLDIDFPFDFRSSKLACMVKIISKSSVTNGKDTNISFDGKFNIIFEKTSQSGSTDIEVTQSEAKETTTEDPNLVVETGDRVYTVLLVPVAFAPGSWHYDPEISLAPVSPSVSNPTSAPTTAPTSPGDDDSSSSLLSISSAFSFALVLLALVI